MSSRVTAEMRVRDFTGMTLPGTFKFSFMVGGEKDEPVKMQWGDHSWQVDQGDLIAFVAALAAAAKKP